MKKGLVFGFLLLLNNVLSIAQPLESITINSRTHAIVLVSTLGEAMDKDTKAIVERLRKMDSVHFNTVYRHIRFMLNGTYKPSSINPFIKSIGSDHLLNEYQALFIRILLTTKWLSLNPEFVSLYFDNDNRLTDVSISLGKKNTIVISKNHLFPTRIQRQDFEEKGLVISIAQQ